MQCIYWYVFRDPYFNSSFTWGHRTCRKVLNKAPSEDKLLEDMILERYFELQLVGIMPKLYCFSIRRSTDNYFNNLLRKMIINWLTVGETGSLLIYETCGNWKEIFDNPFNDHIISLFIQSRLTSEKHIKATNSNFPFNNKIHVGILSPKWKVKMNLRKTKVM